MSSQNDAIVSVVMGSSSDLTIMSAACEVFQSFGIPFETKIVSAHRTPQRMVEFSKGALARGIKVIIAGAGGAAHLPGMIASITTLPVIGVPVKSRNSIDGWDSVLSILQMPGGVPVATVALNGAQNAGLLAVQILALNDAVIAQKLVKYKQNLEEKVLHDAKELEEEGYESFLKNND